MWLVSEFCFCQVLTLGFGHLRDMRHGGGVVKEPYFHSEKGPGHPDHNRQTDRQSFSLELRLWLASQLEES